MKIMRRKYDKEYKIQAVKLAKEINVSRAAKELRIPEGTIRTWLKNAEIGILYLGEKTHTASEARSVVEEIAELRKHIKEQDKEINRLKKENEFLEEASVFFAASRQKLAKTRE